MLGNTWRNIFTGLNVKYDDIWLETRWCLGHIYAYWYLLERINGKKQYHVENCKLGLCKRIPSILNPRRSIYDKRTVSVYSARARACQHEDSFKEFIVLVHNKLQTYDDISMIFFQSLTRIFRVNFTVYWFLEALKFAIDIRCRVSFALWCIYSSRTSRLWK